MRRPWAIIAVLGLGACAARARPEPAAPARPAARQPAAVKVAPAHRIVVGQMCPEAIAGRPGLALLAARGERSWTAAPRELVELVRRGRLDRVGVFAFSGRKAGTFTVLGATTVPGVAAAAAGGYAGALPCADEATAAECATILHGCGVALGAVGPDPVPLEAGKACAAGDALIVDVDGDERPEAFPLAAFARAPEEVTGEAARAPCEDPHFAGALGPTLDLIAVADLDGDGRREVLIAEARQWALYTAPALATRLTLVARGALFAR